MLTFAVLMACLGIFAALIYLFSFWTAFGVVYMAGMLLVALVALLGRSRREPDWERKTG